MKLAVSLAAVVAALSLSISISSSAFAAEKNCMVTRATGVTDGEWQAIEDIVCQAVHDHAPPGAMHYVKVSATNGRWVITLLQDRGGVVSEKQVVLNGIDELPVAAPRLVEAASEQKPIEETQTVTNIITQETRVPKKKASEIHASFGIVGVGAMSGSAQGGAQFSMTVGSPSLSFVGDMRAAGDVINESEGEPTLIES